MLHVQTLNKSPAGFTLASVHVGGVPVVRQRLSVRGHHIRDLWHGGKSMAWDNIVLFSKDIHQTLFKLYNQCYANSPPWTSVGTDYPYGE